MPELVHVIETILRNIAQMPEQARLLNNYDILPRTAVSLRCRPNRSIRRSIVASCRLRPTSNAGAPKWFEGPHPRPVPRRPPPHTRSRLALRIGGIFCR